jgi:hypothetical protein
LDSALLPVRKRGRAAFRFGWADLLGLIGIGPAVAVMCLWLTLARPAADFVESLTEASRRNLKLPARTHWL